MNKLLLLSTMGSAVQGFGGVISHSHSVKTNDEVRQLVHKNLCQQDTPCLSPGIKALPEDVKQTIKLNLLLSAKARQMDTNDVTPARRLLQSCITAKDCPTDTLQWCPENQCTSKSSDYCNGDYDCQGTKVCNNGWCKQTEQVGNELPDVPDAFSCVSAKDCPENDLMWCGSSNLCEPKSSDYCNDDMDCQGTKYCDGGWCKQSEELATMPIPDQSCTTAKDCPEDMGYAWCGSSNTCEPKSSDYCNDDLDCQGDKMCNNGWCQSGASEDGSTGGGAKYLVYPNYALMGMYEEIVDLVYSADDCALECDYRGWCVAFEYARNGGRCVLNRYLSQAGYAPGWDLYIKNFE